MNLNGNTMVSEVISSLSYHSKVIALVLAVKAYVFDDEWHSTKSLFDKYKQYLDVEPVSYRRFSELLNDLENSGLLVSKTSSKGQKGYSSEFQLIVDPEIVGEIIDKTWWKENVVDKKALLDKLDSAEIRKSNPMYHQYKAIKKQSKEMW